MNSTTPAEPGAHILVFPYPAQGHMLALLDLTHQLAHHGLTITILVTPKNLPILTPLLSSSPSIHPLVLPLPPHPSLPSGVENLKDIGNHGNLPLMSSLARLQDPIIHWFTTHPSPPVAILADFFLGWTHHLARHLGVPHIGFFSSGAFLISILHHVCHNLNQVRSQDVTRFLDLPKSPSFARDHLPSIVQLYRESDPEWDLVLDGFLVSHLSWGSVVNTFEELEVEYIEYLRKKMDHARVFGVGPLSLLGGSDLKARGQSYSGSGSGHDVLTWLDGKPDGSVLYVCFGSQKFLTKDQLEALAKGLELSGVHFVWVVKPVSGFDPVLGRGMVIKGWAPQVSILNHRAVGGFLSHCGWNSVLEAVVAGVMILAWPMEADQYVNEKLLVEDHAAAVRVCEGGDTVPDSAELGRRIAESVSGERVEKINARKLKEKCVEAAGEGGSSSRELDRLVRELNQLSVKNK